MASITFILEIVFSITLVLALTLLEAEASKPPSSLLSLLTNTIHHHKQPIIFILDKEAVIKKDRASLDKVISLESSAEDGDVHLMHHLLGHDQHKEKAVQYKKSTFKPYRLDEKRKNQYRVQREHEDRKDDKTLRSPIVKKLLRISNSLRCEAKDECQDKCANKFSGSYKINCKVECSYKYSCDESKEERDECESTECRSESDEQMSTKGVHLVTDKPMCRRC